jgi:phage anti-repressor protein
MQNIIKITQNEQGSNVVSARELYEYLEVSERFSRFMERNLEYGFIENQDYTLYQMVHPSNNQLIVDYVLTLDTAKEVSMIQRTEKGKQARLYFIECEKRNKPLSIEEIIIAQMQGKIEQDKRISQVESKVNLLIEKQENARLELNYIERSTDTVPEIGTRLKISQLVRSYSEKNGISYQDIWKSLYRGMLYSYRFNVNSYKKLHANETKLDIIERNNQLEHLYALASRELN